jgi:lysophospholipase L1-like esterase
MSEPETGRSRPVRAAAGSAALVLGSIALVALAIELVIRSVGISVGTLHINRKTMEMDPNPNLLYRLKPNSSALAEVGYQINQFGQRGPKTTLAKPPGTRRIVVSGDSIAFGYWVDIDAAFGLQLQQMANESRTGGESIEVINLGVPGYNLGQEFEHLQNDGLRFDPDLVIISICMNDLNTIFGYEYGLAMKWEKARQNDGVWMQLRAFALDHSLFAAWLEYRFQYLDYRRRWAGGMHRAEDAPAGFHNAPTAERKLMLAKQKKSLKQAFGTFRRVLRVNGEIPSLIVLFPGLDYDYEIYPHREFHELVADAAARTGMEFLDLLPCYSGYPAPKLAVDPVHPSPIGHRIAAHAILDAIAGRGLIRGVDFDTESFGGCDGYHADDFPKIRGY